MKYITIFGKLHNKYLKSGKSIYWLTEDTRSHEWGFALLEKTWQGSYNIVRFSFLDSMTEPGEFFRVRDELEGKKLEYKHLTLLFNQNQHQLNF